MLFYITSLKVIKEKLFELTASLDYYVYLFNLVNVKRKMVHSKLTEFLKHQDIERKKFHLVFIRSSEN